MSVKCKTFDIYIREMIYHPERSGKWLKDKRLTKAEKAILNCHLLIRSNKNCEAIKEMEAVALSDFDFVEDHRNLLLGICYNNIGKYTLGEKHLLIAKEGFKSRLEHYHLFTTLYNLVINYSNLGKISEMSQIIKKMESMRVDAKLQVVRLLRCQCIHALDTKNNQKFLEYAGKIQKLKSEMPESELGPQLISEFMFYMQNEDLASADQVRQEMKNYKKFTLSENYNFIKVLLDYLRNDSTIYVYNTMFSEPTSCLFYQMKVIESFQSGDRNEALRFWNKLRDEHSKELYQDNFKWGGDKCLFSLCVDKNIHQTENIIDLKGIKTNGPKYQVIYEILSKSKVPVKAEALYEAVYDSPFVDKNDLKRLAKQIFNVRENYNVEVVSKKGTYQLVENHSKKVQTS